MDTEANEPQTTRRKLALLRAVTLALFGTQEGAGENCGKRRDANGERESCVGSSVIRMITITALFHPARHWRRRHGRRLGRDSLGRSRRRKRGRELKARQIFENATEIADLHRMLLHH